MGYQVAAELVICDGSGETHVMLDPGGDHIVIRFWTDNRGYQREVTLSPESDAWDRAVARASRGVAFL